MAAMLIFFIVIIASKARFAAPPPAASASVSPRGVICAGRGSFDRDDLKEAAGAAVRAMEPGSLFWGFEGGCAVLSAPKESGGAGLDACGTAEGVALR